MLASLMTGKTPTFDTIGEIIPEVENHQSKGFYFRENVRVVKTHERWVPRYKRAVYLIRDGRDVCISFYHYQKSLGLFHGSFSAFLRRFLNNQVDGYGGWKRHVESWLSHQDKQPDTVFIVKYENMLHNTFEVLHGITQFLKMDVSEERIYQSIELNKICNMQQQECKVKARQKNNECSIPFVRKATCGQWKYFFSPEDLSAFEQCLGDFCLQIGYPVSTPE